MQERAGHYMPAALLDSQLKTLERPVDEDDVLVVDGTIDLGNIVATIDSWRKK